MQSLHTYFKSYPWLALLLLFLLTTALAGRMLYADLLFVDEYFSIRISGGAHWGGFDLFKIWNDLVTIDNAAGMGVLYHWLIGAWMAFIGASTFSIRLFSLFMGLLTIAMTYRVGTMLYGKQIGLYGAFFLGTSALYIEFMHEARAYTLMIFFSVALLGVYVHLVRDGARRGIYLVLFALLVASLAYTHYVALAWVGALGLWHLWQIRTLARQQWLMIFGAFIVGGLLYLPWMTYMADLLSYGAGDTGRQASSMDNWGLLGEFVRQFSNGNFALLGVLMVYSSLRWRRVALLWAILIASLSAVMVVNALVPFMVHLRYVMFAFVPMALLSALGVMVLSRRGISPLLIVLIWGMVGIAQTLNPAYGMQTFGYVYRPPWTGLSQALDIIRPASQSEDAVIFHMAQLDQEPFMKFPLEHIMYGIDGRYDQAGMINDTFTQGDNLYIEEVRQFIADAPFVWQLTIPEVPTTNLTDVTQYYLDTYYRLCDVRLENDLIDFRLYANAVILPDIVGTFSQADGAGVHLHDLGRSWRSDDEYNIVLGYSFDSAVDMGRYSGGIHILNQAGDLVGQMDFGLPDSRRPYGCQWARLDLSALPAGDYSVRAIIYDWQTGDRLIIDDADSFEVERLRLQERTQ